jgi:hypothetical protein
MAKYRHRTFEMFDFADEATAALASKVSPQLAESDDPSAWTFAHLFAVRSGAVVHVRFKEANAFGADTLGELQNDFTQLARRLVNDSRVLLDFTGLSEFCAASIDALALFNRKLQSKGSRIALCNLPPDVKASFFPHRKVREDSTE